MKIVPLLFLLPWLATAAAATEGTHYPLLTKGAVSIRSAEVYVDKEKKVDFADLEAQDNLGKLHWVKMDNLNFGFTTFRYWLKFSITNETGSQESFILDHTTPLMLVANAYIRTDHGVTVIKSGRQVPVAERIIAHKNFLYPFELDTGKSATVYIQQEASAVNIASFEVYPRNMLVQKTKENYLPWMLYFGILIALVFYNLAVSRDLVSFLYAIYVSFYLLFQATISGLAFEFLWPGAIAWNDLACPVTIALFYGSTAAFTIFFLESWKNSKSAHRILLSIIGVATFLTFVLPFYLKSYPVLRNAYPHFMTSVSALLLLVVYLCRKAKNSGTFALVFTTVLIGNCFYSMRASGWVPNNWFTNHFIQVASLLEVILFSRVIANRMTLLQRIENISIEACHNLRSQLSSLDEVQQSCELTPVLKETIREITLGLEDTSNSVLEVKSLSSTSAKDPRLTTDGELIPGLLKQIGRVEQKIKISVNVPESDLFIFSNVNRIEFKSILHNLVKNAAEGSANQVIISLQASEDLITISVEDNGRGISQKRGTALFGSKSSWLTYFRSPLPSSDKAGGHGIGIGHARQFIEKWDGRISYDPERQIGTKIIIQLPRTQAPTWFASVIEIHPRSLIIALDDEPQIAELWRRRIDFDPKFDMAMVEHLSRGQDLSSFRGMEAVSLFLIDYDLREEKSGLDLIEELGLKSRSVLVTHRWDERRIRERCKKLGIQILPKHLANQVQLVKSKDTKTLDQSQVFCVLIDDQKKVRDNWISAAGRDKLRVLTFESLGDFSGNTQALPKSTKIFVDYSLSDGVTGYSVIERLQSQGFTRVHLATAHDPDDLPPIPGVLIFEKTPFWQTLAGKQLLRNETNFMTDVSIRRARRGEIPWINFIYSEIKFGDSNYDNEYIAIVEITGEKIGLGRLVRLDRDHAEIGGIYVTPEYRGKQVAHKILGHLIEHSHSYKRIFCTPLHKASTLYGSFGFTPYPENAPMPEEFRRKFEWRRSRFPIGLYSMTGKGTVKWQSVLPFLAQKVSEYVGEFTR